MRNPTGLLSIARELEDALLRERGVALKQSPLFEEVFKLVKELENMLEAATK